jgi:hypothetical protein
LRASLIKSEPFTASPWTSKALDSADRTSLVSDQVLTLMRTCLARTEDGSLKRSLFLS